MNVMTTARQIEVLLAVKAHRADPLAHHFGKAGVMMEELDQLADEGFIDQYGELTAKALELLPAEPFVPETLIAATEEAHREIERQKDQLMVILRRPTAELLLALAESYLEQRKKPA